MRRIHSHGIRTRTCGTTRCGTRIQRGKWIPDSDGPHGCGLDPSSGQQAPVPPIQAQEVPCADAPCPPSPDPEQLREALQALAYALGLAAAGVGVAASPVRDAIQTWFSVDDPGDEDSGPVTPPGQPIAQPVPGVTEEGQLAVPHAINQGQQDKHIKGKAGYKEGRSILEADPEELAAHAGSGQTVGERVLGEAGSKERVNFGEVIGVYRTGPDDPGVPTTVGIIHYDGSGTIHIVPARPMSE